MGTHGNSTMFKRADKDYSLLSFADDALEHMKNHGIDTVFYMEGTAASTPPDDTTGAIELFTHHSRYTREEVNTAVDKRVQDGTFDSFAKEALKESGKWLKASLDPSLIIQMRTSLAKTLYGPDVWMLIVAEVLSTAID